MYFCACEWVAAGKVENSTGAHAGRVNEVFKIHPCLSISPLLSSPLPSPFQVSLPLSFSSSPLSTPTTSHLLPSSCRRHPAAVSSLDGATTFAFSIPVDLLIFRLPTFPFTEEATILNRAHLPLRINIETRKRPSLIVRRRSIYLDIPFVHHSISPSAEVACLVHRFWHLHFFLLELRILEFILIIF